MRGWGKFLIIYLFISLQVFLGVSLGYASQAVFNSRDEQVMNKSIVVMGIDLKGMTGEEIYKKLKYRAKNIPPKIIFGFQDRKYLMDVESIGLQYDIDSILDYVFEEQTAPDQLDFTYDREAAVQWLNRYAETINQEPINAKLVGNNGHYQVREGKPGKKIDIDQTLQELERSFAEFRLYDQPAIPLVVKKVNPTVQKQDIEEMTTLLGQSVTRFKTDKQHRVHNLNIAAQSLNRIIGPGESFSFQEEIGPFNRELGYREANVLINAEIEQGIGGGVCQVSSTLYHAGLKSMMEIEEHHPHSVPVNYIPIGMDAAVDNAHLDLVFRNPFEQPVYIQSEVKQGTLTVSFFTRDESLRKQVKIITSDATILPREIKLEASADIEKGKPQWTQKGKDGYRLKVWRLISDGPQVKRELISIVTYPKKDDIISHHPDEDDAVLQELKEKVEKEADQDSVAELG
ncbi:MAG: VanW family protein [Bacillaceae bacterium]|nr:VanW family protein [Bacillaceae bacterium]